MLTKDYLSCDSGAAEPPDHGAEGAAAGGAQRRRIQLTQPHRSQVRRVRHRSHAGESGNKFCFNTERQNDLKSSCKVGF